MSTIFDTSKYILEELGSMSPMKLQKLCYYAQVWSLAWDDSPLFEEDFYAWCTGPVCEELFRKTKENILSVVDAKDMTGGNSNNLSEKQKSIIDQVLHYYGKRDAQWLAQLAMMEDPWIIAKNEIITKESMTVYYSSLAKGGIKGEGYSC